MSLDYSLAKCSDEVNMNGKVADRFGASALYSLTMAMMAVGVPELKTDADCAKLYDRVRALGWFNDSARRDWWQMITTMKGITTNANKSTDAQFSKQLIDKMMREGAAERRQMDNEMTAKTN